MTDMDESRLRHPRERPIFLTSVAVNVAIMAGAVAVAVAGTDWLVEHPMLAKRITEIRLLAVGAVLVVPAIAALNNARFGRVRGNALRLSPEQIPLLRGILERHCARLRLREVPELYMSDIAISEVARAYSAWHRQYIVLGTAFNDGPLEEVEDVFAFTLGRELGRLRLGHTCWWSEALVAYVARTPYLKRPLNHVRTYSLDRYGAFLAPDGVRGLLVLASGREILQRINVTDYLARLPEMGETWARLSNRAGDEPHVGCRVKALYDAGLFDLARDLRRFSALAAPSGPTGVAADGVRS